MLGYVFCFVAVQHVGWDSLTTNVLKSQPRNAERLDKATPAEQAQMLAVTKGFMEGFMVGQPGGDFGVECADRAAALGRLRIRAGRNHNLWRDVRRRHLRRLAECAELIDRHRHCLRQRPTDLQPQCAVARQPGLFPEIRARPAWLLSLAKSLDIFSLWSLALAGFGGAIVSKVKPLRGVMLVFGVWLLYVLVKTGIAAAMS